MGKSKGNKKRQQKEESEAVISEEEEHALDDVQGVESTIGNLEVDVGNGQEVKICGWTVQGRGHLGPC